MTQLAIFLIEDRELPRFGSVDPNSQFVAQQTVLRQMDEQPGSFVTAVMAQGRASYRDGTADNPGSRVGTIVTGSRRPA